MLRSGHIIRSASDVRFSHSNISRLWLPWGTVSCTLGIDRPCVFADQILQTHRTPGTVNICPQKPPGSIAPLADGSQFSSGSPSSGPSPISPYFSVTSIRRAVILYVLGTIPFGCFLTMQTLRAHQATGVSQSGRVGRVTCAPVLASRVAEAAQPSSTVGRPAMEAPTAAAGRAGDASPASSTMFGRMPSGVVDHRLVASPGSVLTSSLIAKAANKSMEEVGTAASLACNESGVYSWGSFSSQLQQSGLRGGVGLANVGRRDCGVCSVT